MREPIIPTPDALKDLVHLYFPGRPKTKKNQKAPGRRGGYYNPAAGYEAVVRDHARIQLSSQKRQIPVFSGPGVVCFFRCYLQNRRAPDAGNIVECILDALQGSRAKEPILYRNDNQVDLLIVRRIFTPSKSEGIELTAWRLEE